MLLSTKSEIKMAAYQPSSFLCLYSSLSLKMPKRTRPIFGHLGRTSLVNQGFIIRDGNWIRNASRKCFWDCYWRCASQLLGTLRSNDADGNENVEKTIGLISKTTNSHVHQTFLYFSFPFLHDYGMKMPSVASQGGRKQGTTKFYFSF